MTKQLLSTRTLRAIARCARTASPAQLSLENLHPKPDTRPRLGGEASRAPRCRRGCELYRLRLKALRPGDISNAVALGHITNGPRCAFPVFNSNLYSPDPP